MSKIETDEDGDRFCYNDKGELHREDGHAVEFANGDKKWYINGKRHREDGPAVELANGHKEWWINGEELTEEEFNKRERGKEMSKIETKSQTITLTTSEYEELVKDQLLLRAYENAGVDNWDGCSYAGELFDEYWQEHVRKKLKDGFINGKVCDFMTKITEFIQGEYEDWGEGGGKISCEITDAGEKFIREFFIQIVEDYSKKLDETKEVNNE